MQFNVDWLKQWVAVDLSAADLATLLNEQSDDFLVWWSNPEHAFFNELLGDQLLAAIDGLPEVYRTVVILVNVEGFTYDETAEVLAIAPGTVRSRMKRGRTLLQKTLWEQRPLCGRCHDRGDDALAL